MKLNPKEEKELRNLVGKYAADRPIFLTQEEGSKLFEEIDYLRKEHSIAVKHSESLVKKYKDDMITESIDEMLSEIIELNNKKNDLKRFVGTMDIMLSRASRIPCHHRTALHNTFTHDCEHCEIVNHAIELIKNVEKS